MINTLQGMVLNIYHFYLLLSLYHFHVLENCNFSWCVKTVPQIYQVILLLYTRYEGALDPWLLSLWRSLNQANMSLLPRISDIINPNLNNLGNAKIEVIYYSCDDAPQDSIVSGAVLINVSCNPYTGV